MRNFKELIFVALLVVITIGAFSLFYPHAPPVVEKRGSAVIQRPKDLADQSQEVRLAEASEQIKKLRLELSGLQADLKRCQTSSAEPSSGGVSSLLARAEAFLDGNGSDWSIEGIKLWRELLDAGEKGTIPDGQWERATKAVLGLNKSGIEYVSKNFDSLSVQRRAELQQQLARPWPSTPTSRQYKALSGRAVSGSAPNLKNSHEVKAPRIDGLETPKGR